MINKTDEKTANPRTPKYIKFSDDEQEKVESFIGRAGVENFSDSVRMLVRAGIQFMTLTGMFSRIDNSPVADPVEITEKMSEAISKICI